MIQYAALIFDLDGTLIDSAPDITTAVNTYFIEQGWPTLDVDYVESFIGHGPRRLLQDIFNDKGLPADEVSITRALDAYIENYARNPAERTRFFPHVPEDLVALREAGFRLGICTNKTHALTERILDLLGLAPLFDAAIGADAVPACKPDPRHLRAVAEKMDLLEGSFAYIGDTRVDRATAEGAGVPFYVVPWGGGANVETAPQQRIERLADLIVFRPDSVMTRVRKL